MWKILVVGHPGLLLLLLFVNWFWTIRAALEMQVGNQQLDPYTLRSYLEIPSKFHWKANVLQRYSNFRTERGQLVAKLRDSQSGEQYTPAMDTRISNSIDRIFSFSVSRLAELKTAITAENAHSLIPEQFNAATHEPWVRCASIIKHVYDQSACGDCFIIATLAALSGRNCIASVVGEQQPVLKLLSSADILTCCDDCPNCFGGFVPVPLAYWLEEGLVTGGDFGDDEGCLSYVVEPCGGAPCEYRFFWEAYTKIDKTCPEKCNDDTDKVKYKGEKAYGVGTMYADEVSALDKTEERKQFIKDTKELTDEEFERMMKLEIMTKGPVSGCTTHHLLDFNFYRSGIYSEALYFVKNDAANIGGHCMTVIGWGKESGVTYWHIVNTYGKDWGDEGTGKIMIYAKRGNKPFFDGFYAGDANHRPVH